MSDETRFKLGSGTLITLIGMLLVSGAGFGNVKLQANNNTENVKEHSKKISELEKSLEVYVTEIKGDIKLSEANIIGEVKLMNAKLEGYDFREGEEHDGLR